MRLYHQSSFHCAIEIILHQEMHPDHHGLCGPGIYFALNAADTEQKARQRGVILSAEVDLGNIMEADKSKCHTGED
jgi:hypothetical protein